MKSMSFPRSVLLGLVLLAMLAIAFAFMFRRSAAAPPADSRSSAPAEESVVCFGTVDLESGVSSLAPVQPGRVTEVLVKENQHVADGTELVRLDDGQARSRLTEAEAGVALAKLQLDQARKLPDEYRDQVKQQEAVVEAARARVTAARQVLERKQKSNQPALVASVETASSELEIRELEALERAETQRLATLKARDADPEIHSAEKSLAVAEARRGQARLGLDDCRVKAPRAGTVLRLLVGPGDILGGPQAQPAILFAPDGPQVIRATVEQEFASRIKEGKAVRVQDEADAGSTWKGHVDRIAGWYSQRRTILHDPSQLSDVRTLECVIVLDADQPRLRLGQSVRVIVGAVPSQEPRS